MTGPFVCGCRGTVHDPTCFYWRQAMREAGVTFTTTEVTTTFEQDIMRKLDRIIALLEEIAGRRR